MGLAFVAVFLYAGSMSTSEIVAAQDKTWFAFTLFPSFVIYVIAMVGETNRAPFDLPEAEGELVGGFHTEYSSLKFALFFLAEYINMATVSALATTLFLGGWHAPFWIDTFWAGANEGYWPFLWFMGKVIVLHLHLHLAARHAAAAALRPVHGVRLEDADPGLARLDRGRLPRCASINLRGGLSTARWLIVVGVVALVLLVARCSSPSAAKPRPRAERRAVRRVRRRLPGAAAGVATGARDVLRLDSDRAEGALTWRFLKDVKEAAWDPVAGFGVTFRTMFRKVVTEQYPFEKVPTAPRFHGRHQLNRWPDGLEKCIGCELCAWACPADAIYVEGASNTDEDDGSGRFSPGERYGRVYQINYLRCILCGLCIEACPTRALTMTNEYELADNNRADLIYEKSDLLAPLLPGMEQPPHAMRLGDDEGDYYRGTLRRQDDGAADAEVTRMIAFWILAPVMVVARARPALRPQGGALRAAAGGRDDQPGGAVRRAGRAVPVRGADHRLHRRDPDAVPVRADAGRRRRLRLGRGDDPRPAAVRGDRRPDLRGHPGDRRRPGLGRRGHRARTTPTRRQRPGHRQDPVHHLRVRLRGHLGAADHRGARRDGAGPPRAARSRSSTQATSRPSGCASTPRPGAHLGPLPPPGVFARHNAVDTPALLPDGTPVRRRRSRGCSRPAARSTRRPGSATQVEQFGGSDERRQARPAGARATTPEGRRR